MKYLVILILAALIFSFMGGVVFFCLSFVEGTVHPSDWSTASRIIGAISFGYLALRGLWAYVKTAEEYCQ